MQVYDGFDNWADIQRSFEMNEPEPEEVILARNESDGGYEEWCLIVYRNGDKYYVNHGSHCSCYGYEDQWEPEQYESRDHLIAALKKGNWSLWDDALRALGEIE